MSTAILKVVTPDDLGKSIVPNVIDATHYDINVDKSTIIINPDGTVSANLTDASYQAMVKSFETPCTFVKNPDGSYTLTNEKGIITIINAQVDKFLSNVVLNSTNPNGASLDFTMTDNEVISVPVADFVPVAVANTSSFNLTGNGTTASPLQGTANIDNTIAKNLLKDTGNGLAVDDSDIWFNIQTSIPGAGKVKNNGSFSLMGDGIINVNVDPASVGSGIPVIVTKFNTFGATQGEVPTVQADGTVAFQAIPTAPIQTVDNGLSLNGTTAELGGSLIKDTTIDQSGKVLNITNSVDGVTSNILSDGTKIVDSITAPDGVSTVSSFVDNVVDSDIEAAAALLYTQYNVVAGEKVTGNGTTTYSGISNDGTTVSGSSVTGVGSANVTTRVVAAGNVEARMTAQDGSNTTSVFTNGLQTVIDFYGSAPTQDIFDKDYIKLGQYPNTRDDSSVDTPINFIYSDASGKLESAPLTTLLTTLLALPDAAQAIIDALKASGLLVDVQDGLANAHQFYAIP